MLGRLSQDLTLPKEVVVRDGAYAASGDTVIVDYVPSIQATRIDVIIRSTGALSAVNLVIEAAAGDLEVESAPLGSVSAATTTGFSYTGFIGQWYKVQVTEAAAATGTATVWTVARS